MFKVLDEKGLNGNGKNTIKIKSKNKKETIHEH